jgi:sulfur relay (sulfurtransferase) complex TusBCD TusD component (DsrE family)
MNIKLVIAVKSNDLTQLTKAYEYTVACLTNPELTIEMIFFYQEAAYLLSNSAISNQWQNLLISNKLTANVCKSAAKKRGITNIELPFKPSSLVEFINNIDNSDRFMQF